MKKIKVLHLTTHLNVGGITTYIYLLGKNMDRNLYEIMVLSSGGEVSKRFHAMGIRTFDFPFRTKSELSPKIYLNLPKIIKLVKKESIDLIHAHTRVTQVMAWWIRQLTGVPYISTCHGFYKRRIGRRFFPAWGNHVVAISVPVEGSLTNYFKVPTNQVSTIFNAIDIKDLETHAAHQDLQKIRAEWQLGTSAPVIGIVSRIVQDKGHEYLIRAFGILIQKKYPDAKLLIVGEGPYQSKIQELTRKLNIFESVRFIGTLNDVTKALSVIDIFVLPAIWREGFGLSIVEAMALKKPVIVTNIWALNALVQDHQNGLLVEPKDVGKLVTAMNELLEHKALAEQIGRAGYETVRKEFLIERMAEKMGDLYQKILQENQK